MGLAGHLDDAIAKGNNLVQVVIYDLPNRDCAALASNGEIPSGGLTTYETQFIDPIVSILKTPKYASLRVVTVIEPDSLPNLETNADQQATATEACRKAKSTGESSRAWATRWRSSARCPTCTTTSTPDTTAGWAGTRTSGRSAT